MKNDYLERILRARVYDVAVESPLKPARILSRRLGNGVLLKREDMQAVFSFKLRGAYNKMVQLPPAALKRGVIAASAGNHAQGVALAAQKLGCRAIIVMPTTTPRIKIDAVVARGAEVLLAGESYSEAAEEARRICKRRRLAYVHPYDDPDVIAGQGTIAMEILRQTSLPIHAIFTAIGGGGLISGIAAYVKRLHPEIKVIGVQPVDSNAMYQSIKAGRRIRLEHVGLFADGVAVKRVGVETFRICRELVDEILIVDTDATCAAMKDVFDDTRTILEPAGALSIAGLKAYVQREGLRGQNLVAVTSGANTNFDRLRFVAERAEVGEHREAILAVTIPETPGSFRKFCAAIGARSITEFNYRMADASEAHVFAGIEVNDLDETKRIIKGLRQRGFATLDLSQDETAKLHVRHLVGGHAPPDLRRANRHGAGELLYRFEFPERPGALMAFLNAMGSGWNISLFHYRNLGGDYGRVLVGMQVPRKEMPALRRFLKTVGYPFEEETSNAAYRLFLG